jgi:hypothetical protein
MNYDDDSLKDSAIADAVLARVMEIDREILLEMLKIPALRHFSRLALREDHGIEEGWG